MLNVIIKSFPVTLEIFRTFWVKKGVCVYTYALLLFRIIILSFACKEGDKSPQIYDFYYESETLIITLKANFS